MSDSTMIEEYDIFQRKTSFYMHCGEANIFEFTYLADGLAGETGEFMDTKKKFERVFGLLDHDAFMTHVMSPSETREKLLKELGDVFWYMNRIANIFFGMSVVDLMAHNTFKLYRRHCMGPALRMKADWPFTDLHYSYNACAERHSRE